MRTAWLLLVSFAVGACARPEPGARHTQVQRPATEVAPGGGEAPAPARRPAGEEPPRPETPPVPVGLREVFPFVRVDARAKVVELDGVVPIDAHDPQAPHVYLEVVVCTPDTKEHETLVVTRARPSHVHAALLAIGLAPGKPGSWDFDGEKLISFPPEGSAVEVTIAYRDAGGREIEARASDWIVSAQDERPILSPEAPTPFVFAGSLLARRGGREVYDADGTGTLVGLATFGMETVAWREVISHDATVTAPEWIANPRLVPKYETTVIVRLRPAR